MPIFLPRFLAALWLAFLLGGVLSGNANPLPITRGVIEALKDEPDQDVLGIRFILSQLARAVVIASVPSIQRSTATPWPWRRTTMPIRRNLAPHALEADAVVRPDLLAFKAFAKDAFEQPAD